MPISLSSNEVIQFLIGGVVSDSITDAGLSSASIDYNAQTLTLTLAEGVFASGVLKPSPNGETITIRIDAVAGTWQKFKASEAMLSGSISPAAQTAILAFIKSSRNTLESSTVSQGAIAGTQSAWV